MLPAGRIEAMVRSIMVFSSVMALPRKMGTTTSSRRRISGVRKLKLGR